MWDRIKNIYYNYMAEGCFDTCCITGGESSPYFSLYLYWENKINKETNV